MANCSYCDSFILLGGRTDQTGRYCNQRCQQAGNLLAFSQRIPNQEIVKLVRQVQEGNCPRCQGRGPIDVHKAHQVWSALILTSWSSSPAVSCKSCATKRQLSAMVFSGLFGWWGFPWGLIMTPVQVVRNITELLDRPDPSRASPLLERIVRLQAAAQLAQSSQNATARKTPPPLPKAREIAPPLPALDDSRYMPKA